MIFVALFALFGAAWDFGFGVAGIINLGPGVAFGFGSYSFVYFALAHYPPVVAVLGAAAAASLTGFIYWIPSIRTSGTYLAIVTLILLLLAGEIALANTGEEGISAGLNYYTPSLMQSYYASLGAAFFGTLILFLLSYSRFGLKLKAMRDDETAAKSIGINVYFFKLATLVISSFFLGISGALTAFFINHTHSDFGIFGITTNFLGIVISVIGGTATIFGSIIGALIVELPANYLTSYSTYAVIAYGATMVLVVLFLRSGILSVITTIAGRFRRSKSAEEKHEQEHEVVAPSDRRHE
ncbi:MAG: branched-chain amino acid ABC transporter permease [Thaumarchaeota archaeon]|nr:branched-chain amino acid ABC transporter permease [Nitrososphaerota archaeon]